MPKLRCSRVVSSRVRHIVAVSDAIRDYIPRTVGIHARRVSTIHNGISSAPAPARSGSATGLTFVTVGRLDAVKNQALMLRAFAGVAATLPQARLILDSRQ